MADFQLSDAAQHWVNVVLIWIGFGTVVALLAKTLVPGREPGGPVAILTIGVLGSVVGLTALSYLLKQDLANPISPLGLLAATGATLVLLIGYRLLAAAFAGKADAPAPPPR